MISGLTSLKGLPFSLRQGEVIVEYSVSVIRKMPKHSIIANSIVGAREYHLGTATTESMPMFRTEKVAET